LERKPRENAVFRDAHKKMKAGKSLNRVRKSSILTLPRFIAEEPAPEFGRSVFLKSTR
jgi:hypothetical protein